MHDPAIQRQQQIELAKRLVFARNRARAEGRLVRNVDLADFFDISHAAVGLWYRTGKIDHTKLPDLAKLFNVDPTWLMTGDGQPDPSDASSAEDFDIFKESRARQEERAREISRRHDPNVDYGFEMRYTGRPPIPSRLPRPISLADAEDLVERYELLPREGRRIIEAALQIAEHLYKK